MTLFHHGQAGFLVMMNQGHRNIANFLVLFILSFITSGCLLSEFVFCYTF